MTPSTAANIKQAIKTGIAGVASLYVSELLKLREGYWAAISAVIVMQSNVDAAVSASWIRLTGTAIGATVGGVLAATWGANALAFGVAVTITVLICSFLGLLESYRLACATVAIVMLIGRLGSPWSIAIHRFTGVALGIVVAVLVTAAVWPARAREHLRQGIVEALHGLSTLSFGFRRKSGRGGAGYDLNEVVRFHSFLFSLRNLARELQLAQAAEKQPPPSAH